MVNLLVCPKCGTVNGIFHTENSFINFNFKEYTANDIVICREDEQELTCGKCDSVAKYKNYIKELKLKCPVCGSSRMGYSICDPGISWIGCDDCHCSVLTETTGRDRAGCKWVVEDLLAKWEQMCISNNKVGKKL